MKWFKTKQVRNRIFYTIFILILFQIGTFLTLPGVKSTSGGSSTLSSLLNLTSGGSLSRFGILALGVSPYVTASIIVQILSKGISKKYTELQERGHSGQLKLSQYTRYWSLFFGITSGLAILFTNDLSTLLSVKITATVPERIMLAIILSAGGLFVSYLGDLINENGIGNGQSLLISSGILTSLPLEFYNIFDEELFIRTKDFYISLGILIASYVAIILFTYLINKKEFIMPLQSKTSLIQTKAHYLPIKLLASSVVPVIFATSSLTIIQAVSVMLGKQWEFLDFTTWMGMGIYSILIFVFTYLYNFVQVDSVKISKDLVRSGLYIIGIPDKDSSKYLNKKIIHISNIGAPVLTSLAVFSILIQKLSPVDFNLSLSGISLLIVVSTFQEVYYQIKGLTEKNNYKELI